MCFHVKRALQMDTPHLDCKYRLVKSKFTKITVSEVVWSFIQWTWQAEKKLSLCELILPTEEDTILENLSNMFNIINLSW